MDRGENKEATMKLIGKDLKSVKHIIQATFPDYKGRKFFLQPKERAPKDLRSYWDEGSRTYYAFYNLDTQEVLHVHSNHPMFEANQPSKLRELPTHVVLATYAVYCGREAGVTLYADLTKLIFSNAKRAGL